MALPTLLLAAAGPPPDVADPIPTLLDAFRTHRVVALGENHAMDPELREEARDRAECAGAIQPDR